MDKKLKELGETEIKLLKKPLPSEAISQHPTKKYLSTIKAIYVVERLNEVFGIGGWRLTSRIIDSESKMVTVKGFLSIPAYGIELESYGGNDNADAGDALKGAVTDALTKMASYLEIGMDVFKGHGDEPSLEEERKEKKKGKRVEEPTEDEKVSHMRKKKTYSDNTKKKSKFRDEDEDDQDDEDDDGGVYKAGKKSSDKVKKKPAPREEDDEDEYEDEEEEEKPVKKKSKKSGDEDKKWWHRESEHYAIGDDPPMYVLDALTVIKKSKYKESTEQNAKMYYKSLKTKEGVTQTDLLFFKEQVDKHFNSVPWADPKNAPDDEDEDE